MSEQLRKLLESVKEATLSAVNSFQEKDLSEWELHLINRRTDAALALLTQPAHAGESSSAAVAPAGEVPPDGGHGYYGQFVCPKCCKTVSMHQNAAQCAQCFAALRPQVAPVVEVVERALTLGVEYLLGGNTLASEDDYTQVRKAIPYFVERITAALSAIPANTRMMGEWQPIEAAPKDGTTFRGGWFDKGEWYAVDGLRWTTLDGFNHGWANETHSTFHGDRRSFKPTHWMPEIPAPPYTPATDEQVETYAKHAYETERLYAEYEGQHPEWKHLNEKHKQLLLEDARKELDGKRYRALTKGAAQ